MIKRLLDIVDDQDGFMIPNSDLPVTDADKIIPPTNSFLASLQPTDIDAALVKYDTHFPGEYPFSPESVPFPNIHCAYGTAGWQLAIDLDQINSDIPVFHMMKNEFDMWGSNPTGVDRDKIVFSDQAEENAYNSLFTIKSDVHAAQPGASRDEWMTRNIDPKETEVCVIGVASDFCVLDALKGYLARGYNVIVLEDLTKGLGVDPSRSPTGDIQDVCQRNLSEYQKSGQLRIMKSDEYLRYIRSAPAQAPTGPQPGGTEPK